LQVFEADPEKIGNGKVLYPANPQKQYDFKTKPPYRDFGSH